jgi:hypothetical protein
MNANIFETIARIIVQNNAHQFKHIDEDIQEITFDTLNRIFRQMYSLSIFFKTFLEREVKHETIEIEEDVFEAFMMHQEMLTIECRISLQSVDSHPAEMIAKVIIEQILQKEHKSLNFIQTLAFIGQIFVLLNITHCIEEEDVYFEDNEEEIECLNMFSLIIDTFAVEAEIIEIIDNQFSTYNPEGDVMNAKEEVIYGIMQHVFDNEEHESLKHIRRTAMYLALHSDEVNVLKNLTTQDHSIQFGIANTIINNNETIHSICEYLIENNMLHEQAEQEIARTVLHFLCTEEEMPHIETTVEYAHIMYDIFQMMRLSFVIEDRIELIDAMKSVFTDEEHEEYQELIQYINATSDSMSEESTT